MCEFLDLNQVVEIDKRILVSPIRQDVKNDKLYNFIKVKQGKTRVRLPAAPELLVILPPRGVTWIKTKNITTK